jgi:AraC-like DNA-binding protein
VSDIDSRIVVAGLFARREATLSRRVHRGLEKSSIRQEDEAMGGIDFDVPEIDLIAIGSVTLPPGTADDAPFRTTDRVEVAWVVAGSTHVTSDGTRYDLTPGSALYLPPGPLNHFRFDTHASTTSCFAQFRMVDPPRDCVLRHLTAEEFSWSMLGELTQLERYRPPQWTVLAEHILSYLVWSLLVGDWVADAHEVPEPIERMIELVRHRWQRGPLRSPTLAELAVAARVDPSYLCRVVSRTTGHSPLAALRLIRIDRAATLLRYTSQSVGRIAQETGFESSFHFSRVFAVATGFSPTVYRSGTMRYELPDGVRRISKRL